MIVSLRGMVAAKEQDKIVLEAAGVGYEIFMTSPSISALPEGQEALVYVHESFGLYGGGQSFYGFLSPAEKALFVTFKECIPSTGAKKALEYLEKASKSLPDFRRAILEKDSGILCDVFGFTKKTAQRLIDALKDAMPHVPASGPEKYARAGAIPAGSLGEALNALAALGYKGGEARAALEAVTAGLGSESVDAEKLVRLALKEL